MPERSILLLRNVTECLAFLVMGFASIVPQIANMHIENAQHKIRYSEMNEASQNYIRSTRLTDILDLQRIARGVNMDIAQLDAGAFESDVTQLRVRNVLVSLITSNRRLRLQGNVDFLTASFISGESESPQWHGISANSGSVLIADAGESFDLVVPPGLEAYCVSVVGNADVTLRNLGGPVVARKLTNTAKPIPCDADAVQRIGGWFAEQFANFGSNVGISIGPALQLEQEFLRQLAACLRAETSSSGEDGSTARARFDVVHRVEQHLLDDLAIPQTVDDLCRVAGTSRRTLEYAFKDYFGTSPKRFTKALRLNAARNDLIRGNSKSAQVVKIASGWGFTHMGQFSTDYRHMFGEKPSETLHRNASRNGV